ncbi:MAG TPA: M15 family metallopeptidase [Chitinophagaceae bacterium]|nr:M15 family metallopeptidase [Chitinophagaceae bacterium]
MAVKIRFQLQTILFAVISFSTLDNSFAQDTTLNKYGLWVIKDVRTLNGTIASDSNKQMADIKKIIPNIILDLRYATSNNFMHSKLYPPVTATYIRLPAARALQNIQGELNERGLGLKIYDAYRPYSVTERMWEPIKDDRYVADPKKGSGHNRGIAVDLTIIDLKTKKELPMGTGYDNFSDTAHQTFMNLPQKILQNRDLLKALMEKYGFKLFETEWWHYSLPNAANYEILDIPFKKLRKITRSGK